MTGASAERLLGLPVRLHGIQLGRPTDLILDPERRKVLGFEVRCGDDEHRFLPLSTVAIEEESMQVASALVLLEEAQLAFYTQRGSTFRSLRGLDVARRRELLGKLEDLEVAPDGTIVAAVAATPHGADRIPYDEDVEIGPARTVSAAS